MWFEVKQSLRAFSYAACEQIWACSFALAGLVKRDAFQWWAPLGGERVLVIAPHPDDESTGCGGTMARHMREGDKVIVLQVTDGRAAHSFPIPPNPLGKGRMRGDREQSQKQMAELRIQEARVAVKILGVTRLEQLSLREGDWSEKELVESLRARLVHIDPKVIYAPSCIDYHPEHLRVARALAAALKGARLHSPIRVYEITVPLGWNLVNCVADTSSVTDVHDAALAAYHSQRIALAPIRRLRRYRASYFRTATSAEVFWQTSPDAYQALMKRGDWLGAREWQPHLTPYRSLRAHPFTDPLAFWQGARTRRSLMQSTERKV